MCVGELVVRRLVVGDVGGHTAHPVDDAHLANELGHLIGAVPGAVSPVDVDPRRRRREGVDRAREEAGTRRDIPALAGQGDAVGLEDDDLLLVGRRLQRLSDLRDPAGVVGGRQAAGGVIAAIAVGQAVDDHRRGAILIAGLGDEVQNRCADGSDGVLLRGQPVGGGLPGEVGRAGGGIGIHRQVLERDPCLRLLRRDDGRSDGGRLGEHGMQPLGDGDPHRGDRAHHDHGGEDDEGDDDSASRHAPRGQDAPAGGGGHV